jgi:hypothetical protein
MKYVTLVSILIVPKCLNQSIQNNNPNPIINPPFNVTKENFSNSDGGISYSVDQILNFTYNEEKNCMQIGVQLSLIIHLLEKQIFKNPSFLKPVGKFIIIDASTFLNKSLDYLKKNTEVLPQNLDLLGNTTICGGNSFSFKTWNTTSEVKLYEQQSSSLSCASKVYTLDEVNATKPDIFGVVSFFTSKNINSGYVSNTLAFTSSATLTNISNISKLKVGEIFNLEVSTTNLKVCGGLE